MSDSPERFDDLVIGTGQAGKPLAGALAEAGRRVGIVERDRVGGTCVVRGCTPSKTMVASARVAHLARRSSDYGVRTGSVSVDMEAVRRRKREIVDDFVRGSLKGLERHETLELIEGDAAFTGPREISVRLEGGGSRTLTAERIFLNSGARPASAPIPGLDEVDFLDSTSIMELAEVPDHLLVLGGGFVGLEFAQMYRRFGAHVTVVESGPRLAGREDEDVSEAVEEILRDDGITVRASAEAKRVRESGAEVHLTLETEDGAEELRGSHLLVAVGRVPNTDTLDPAAAGLATDDRGYVPVNERCETNVEGVWALGDVSGAPPFTHVAYDDYRVVRANLLDGEERTRDRILPYTVFIDPPLGRVGLTENGAREKGHRVRVARLPMSRVARALETDETRGLMKVVVDAETDRILGAAILGIEGGEVATVVQVAMMGDLPYTALRDAVISHPLVSESLNTLFMEMDG